MTQFKKLSCYIMQDNQLHGNLSVEEAMTVAANLKLDRTEATAHRDDVVSRMQIQSSLISKTVPIS